MLSKLLSMAAPTLSSLAAPAMLLKKGLELGSKHIKYFVDSHFRDHVRPVPGSVLYCDLLLAAEHSGIYVGDGDIANIEVDSLLTASSTVRRSSPAGFTSKSPLGRKIYVSCDKHGAVGGPLVARGADAHVGDPHLYLLLLKNCHAFSQKCVNYSDYASEDDVLASIAAGLGDGTSGLGGISALKAAARKKLGATTWRLWDWDGSLEEDPPDEPDWQDINQQFARQPLNPESAQRIRDELAEMQAYMAEVADENIPDAIRQKMRGFATQLAAISEKYEEVKSFLAQCPGANLSYEDLQSLGSEDFTALARDLQSNARIKELARKMGRAYISEERKKQARIPEASRSEVHGTHLSNDVMRMLPSELLNLEDEALEHLFYARLLEQQLQTYELQGTTLRQGETTEAHSKRTGPVVACLDTSGSMQGEPLRKAKALLLAIANMLQAEQRSLHVVLFGSSGQTREFALEDVQSIAGLLHFLQHGFGGGTDFEAPLERAMQIIAEQPAYEKADVLMISDGDCTLSDAFAYRLRARKAVLNCRVYSVLCNGQRVADGFSDEVAVL